jgi:hypothetical protein
LFLALLGGGDFAMAVVAFGAQILASLGASVGTATVVDLELLCSFQDLLGTLLWMVLLMTVLSGDEDGVGGDAAGSAMALESFCTT